MANNGRSEPGLFGRVNHYDEHGKKVGYSEPGLFGGYVNYDANGKKVGSSEPGLFGGYTNYDAHGKKIGRTEPGLFGGYNHYDAHGNKTGSSDPGLFGGYRNRDTRGNSGTSSSRSGGGQSSEGCYVATCVYGSYDCPQVWTLRRFRDDTLGKNFWGRLFIRTYYALSPTIVRWFGGTKWFKEMWRGVLDRMISDLNGKGVADTPYRDKNWR